MRTSWWQVRLERAKERRAEVLKQERKQEEQHNHHKGRGALQREKKRKRLDEAAQGGGGGEPAEADAEGEGNVQQQQQDKHKEPKGSSRKVEHLEAPPRRAGAGEGIIKPGTRRRARPAVAGKGVAKLNKNNMDNKMKQRGKAASKVKEDGELERMVAHVGEVMPKTNKARRKRDAADELDKLASDYKSRLFGHAVTRGGGGGRWFD